MQVGTVIAVVLAMPSWIRTLPWLAGLLLGATAHIVWWSNATTRAPEVRVVEVHVHHNDVQEPGVIHPLPQGAKGAVICSRDGCTIRRDFAIWLLDNPGMLGETSIEGLRIRGAFPGSLADLLGLRNGDTIVAIDSVALRPPTLGGADGITVTLLRDGMRHTLRYRIIDR
jgi:hypothetical protein